MSKVCIFLADGFEEIEGLTAVDILRRAGVETETVSIMGRKCIHGSHGILVEADSLLEESSLGEADMLVLPGGLVGTENLEQCQKVREEVEKAYEEGRWVAAICAAPRILAELGILKGRRATIYPSMENCLKEAEVIREMAVADGNVITGRGMGAAIPFALLLVAKLLGQEKADEVAESIVFQA